MPRFTDILEILGVIAAAVVMIVVVTRRRKGKATHDLEFARENVCEHLRPGLELLLARGAAVSKVGQNHPELPLEIHLSPAFDPRMVYEEAKLAEPVFVSERNVLYCKEDWCELHPRK